MTNVADVEKRLDAVLADWTSLSEFAADDGGIKPCRRNTVRAIMRCEEQFWAQALPEPSDRQSRGLPN